MIKQAFFVFAALFSGSALAQEHLVPKSPDNSFVAQDYNRIVASVLKDAFTDDVVVKMGRWNPLGTESFVGIKKVGDDFRLFFVGSTERLFSYAEIDNEKHSGASQKDIARWKDELGPLRSRPEDVPVERCERRIDYALANAIIFAFESMISGTRRYVPKPAGAGEADVIVVDGTSYEFSNSSGAIGTADGPSAKGQAADLINIARSMGDFCQSGDGRDRAKLNEGLEAFRNDGDGKP